MSSKSDGRVELSLGLNAVIVAVTEEQPRILAVGGSENGGAAPALPFGPLDPAGHRTMELGLRRWVREQTGLELGYVEQLYTFGDRDRLGESEGSRELAVAYLALIREAEPVGEEARFWPAYDFLPWEDWRQDRPAVISDTIAPALDQWVSEAPESFRSERAERAEIAFGLGTTPWDEERVLDRYELLYETGQVAEARLRRPPPGVAPPLLTSQAMRLDHRRMLATALGRLRGKLKYRPLVFELMPERFTLLQLQRVVEALSGVRLHKQNFRRLVEKGGLVEGTGEVDAQTGGRPAELFRFRRRVLRERPAPGVGLPGARPRPSAP